MTGMAGIHQPVMQKDEWLTPKLITDTLGPFDLDPCSPGERRPWDTARVHLSLPEDGLQASWTGKVWLNPPYGKETDRWLEKLSSHGNGIALIFARTETKMFFDRVWGEASALLFLKGRLTFHHVDGTKAKANSGAPSVLVAYGDSCAEVIEHCGLEGKFIRLKSRGAHENL